MSRVGLVVVSHSAQLAAGVAEVAEQMAPNVSVIPAGGTAEGGIGTDYDAVTAAIEQADSGAGVVVLYDLGSARMVAEMAIEMADNAHLADAPLVEGAVAAAVSAEGGANVTAVAQAAEEAAAVLAEASPTSAPPAEAPLADAATPAEITITLTNDIGLHARPAAMVARAMTPLDATVTIHFNNTSADARSVLALMALGARGGDQIRITATGPQAPEALATLENLATNNFGD